MRILSFIFLFVGVTKLSAQHFCYTTEMQNEWLNKHPELRQAFEQHRKTVANNDKLQNHTGQFKGFQTQTIASSTVAANYTIPVVFHILHTGGSENISDAQVIDAVNILTRDFNKRNADTTDVVLPFINLVGNPKIEFRLATKDPQGNCTNGIIRHWDANTNWSNDFADYIYSWPHNRYLNIYVVKSMGGGAAGYTFLPGSGVPNSADAIVILSTYVGSVGTGNTGSSRALTHEVGHWLDLEHTWGFTNQPGVSCGDDGIGDTPITKGFNSCNLNNAAICNPNVIENMQNYMDYAYCQRMFTLGQSNTIVNSISGQVNGRNNLSTPQNLANTGVTTSGSGCVTFLDILALPSLTICAGNTLSLKSFTSNSVPTSYLWAATNNGLVQNPTGENTTIQFNSVGTSTVSCTVNSPGGNVSKSLIVTVKSSQTDYTNNYSESFETNVLPSGWSVINNSSPGEQWQLYNGAGSLGVKSVYVPGEILPANTIQILESPSYDFKNNPGAKYTFKYAYARFTSANKDVFKVQASKNCGGNWTDVWVPSTAGLAGPSAGTSQLLLVPYNEWVFYDLSAHPAFYQFTSESNVKFRFYFQEDPNGSGFGNRLYLDEINFSASVGINELSRAIDFGVYPNPTNAAFKIEFTLSDAAKINFSLTNIMGQVILDSPQKNYELGKHQIVVNNNSELAAGIYFVNVELNGLKLTRKIIID